MFLAINGGPCLGPFERRSDALAAERPLLCDNWRMSEPARLSCCRAATIPFPTFSPGHRIRGLVTVNSISANHVIPVVAFSVAVRCRAANTCQTLAHHEPLDRCRQLHYFDGDSAQRPCDDGIRCSANGRPKMLAVKTADGDFKFRPATGGQGVKLLRGSGVSSRRTETRKVVPERRSAVETVGGTAERRMKAERTATQQTAVS